MRNFIIEREILSVRDVHWNVHIHLRVRSCMPFNWALTWLWNVFPCLHYDMTMECISQKCLWRKWELWLLPNRQIRFVFFPYLLVPLLWDLNENFETNQRMWKACRSRVQSYWWIKITFGLFFYCTVRFFCVLYYNSHIHNSHSVSWLVVR